MHTIGCKLAIILRHICTDSFVLDALKWFLYLTFAAAASGDVVKALPGLCCQDALPVESEQIISFVTPTGSSRVKYDRILTISGSPLNNPAVTGLLGTSQVAAPDKQARDTLQLNSSSLTALKEVQSIIASQLDDLVQLAEVPCGTMVVLGSSTHNCTGE